MKKNIIITIVLFICLPLMVSAQEANLKLNLNYNYSFPVNNFNTDLVSNASPRGFTGNLMYQVNPKFSVGLGVGYQDYYQKNDRQNYKLGESQDISAVLTNSIQMVPVMARIEYNPLGAMAPVQPYIAIAAGANFINYDQYLGQFASGQASTGFRALAGLGVKIPVGKTNGWGLDIGGSYDYAPYKKFHYQDMNTVNVHGGIYFSLK